MTRIKIASISILLTILLSACGSTTEQDAPKGTLSSWSVVSVDPSVNIQQRVQMEIYTRQQEVATRDVQLLEQQKPKLLEQKREYDKTIAAVASGSSVSQSQANVIVQKYGKYIVEYQRIKYPEIAISTTIVAPSTIDSLSSWATTLGLTIGKVNTGTLLKQYEEFFATNLAADGMISATGIVQKLAQAPELPVLYKQAEEIAQYQMPDGSMATADFKDAFEKFKTSNNSPYDNDIMALEAFKRNIYISDLELSGKCEDIPDEIRKSRCVFLRDQSKNR